jgi:hypothetical protein
MIPTLQLGQFGRSNSGALTPQPNFSNVVLLIHGDSFPLIDSSLSKKGIAQPSPTTGTNHVELDTASKKYGAGSVKFVGSDFDSGTEVVKLAPSADWALGTVWCLEAWVNTTAGNICRIFDTRVAVNTGCVAFLVDTSNQVVVQVGATAYGQSSPAATVVPGTWTHVAVTCDGTNVRTFVRGILATTTAAAPNISTTANMALIGNNYLFTSGSTAMSLDDLRITKGEAVYTAAFTPPTSAHPDTGIVIEAAPTATYANVKLLLHGDGADASTTFTDNGSGAKTVTVFGNAQIDTAQSVFGGASILLDGTGDYATVPDHADWDFGTGDFTLECWARIHATPAVTFSIVTCYTSSTVGWSIYVTSGRVPAWNATGDAADITARTALTLDGWNHVAVCKISGVLYIYVDGQLENIILDTQTTDCAGALYVGRLTTISTARDWNGHLDDVRVTKGQGVYPRSFLVPAAAFPNS